jgi:hypothetical protein
MQQTDNTHSAQISTLQQKDGQVIIDETGAIASQHDQQMQSQGVPTSLWVPGESARGHFVLPTPASADPTTLRLRIGIYEPVSGRQLPVASGDQPAGDPFLVLPVAPE